LTEQVTGAQVMIEALDEHRKQRLYRARMELAMPDGVVVVTHDHPSNVAHEDVYVAIRNAFRAARRQLEDYFKTRGLSPETRRASESVDGQFDEQISNAPLAGSSLAGPSVEPAQVQGGSEFVMGPPPSEKRFG
jgi:hypothetical protein